MVHRRRRTRRYGRRRLTGRETAAAVAVRRPPGPGRAPCRQHAGRPGAGQHSDHGSGRHGDRLRQVSARQAVQWGGTGPGAYDCSGLVMVAYRRPGSTLRGPRKPSGLAAAGASLPGQPGDLVFFAGADGTTTLRVSRPGDCGQADDRGLCHWVPDQDHSVRAAELRAGVGIRSGSPTRPRTRWDVVMGRRYYRLRGAGS